ncbi:hypothetical protein GCM10025867_14910 [Frondihabitans sucicola]|uniref:DUF1700 domain-containing protein n=1 Tax=Frondihabitans sucicola TaxID=1268041 RepID=A0ABN6XZY7_9MICO|nr:hypothetical protein [Frondihabitans sucicola]BDZ49250.1 hypothetical protein GCM10025867_14910 [Frondihabitans sucicola]
MSELERHYRASIRCYSARWRRVHGEALLDTLLQVAEAEGRARPTGRELRNIVRMGLRQRALTAAPFFFFVIAALGGLGLLLAWHAGIQSTLVFSVPAIPAHPEGQLYTTPSLPVVRSVWVGLGGAAMFVVAAGLGVVLLRRNHRAVKTPRLDDAD